MSIGLVWTIVKNIIARDEFQLVSMELLAQMLAAVSPIPAKRWIAFLEWAKAQSTETIQEIETLLGYEISFGSPGAGLTDSKSNPPPDLPAAANEFRQEILALKALNSIDT